MIKIYLKHTIFNTAINMVFDGVTKHFKSEYKYLEIDKITKDMDGTQIVVYGYEKYDCILRSTSALPYPFIDIYDDYGMLYEVFHLKSSDLRVKVKSLN